MRSKPLFSKAKLKNLGCYLNNLQLLQLRVSSHSQTQIWKRQYARFYLKIRNFLNVWSDALSVVRAGIVIGLVKEHGVALAEVARRVGVSTSAISKIIKRGK